MSKKRFTQGMESLFTDSSDEELRLERSAPQEGKRGQEPRSTAPATKDFRSDLQSFLQEAFEESFEEQLREEERQRKLPPEERKTKQPQRPLSGLDALIRNTLEPAVVSVDPSATRRLVVTFREAQLEKLRLIAKVEKTYLKKIINDIVEGFIAQYEDPDKKK